MVYLDLTHKDPRELETKLGGILEIYRKFVGEDPVKVPMRIFPAVHYTMGGLWTTYRARDDLRGMVAGAPESMMCSIRGLYAFGEVNYQYHGATRLGANALLSCIFDGLFCGPGVVSYVREHCKAPAGGLAPALFEEPRAAEEQRQARLLESSGSENPYLLGHELGEEMTAAATVVKTEARMQRALDKIAELKRRCDGLRLSDTGLWTNQNLSYARALGDMLRLAEAIVAGGIERRESRGSHYRTDYPQRDDANFLATTIAEYDPQSDRPVISFEPVQTGLIPPRARTYGKAKEANSEQRTANRDEGSEQHAAKSQRRR
jgi:succinate dehydrogenase / fumarate reductase flavoprotein subunit